MMKNIRYILYIIFWAMFYVFIEHSLTFVSWSLFEKTVGLKLSQFIIDILFVISIFFVIFWLFSIVEYFSEKIITKITSKTHSKFDDHFAEILFKSLYSLKFIASLYIAFVSVDFSEKYSKLWDNIISIGFIFVLVIFATRFSGLFFTEKISKYSKGKNLSKSLLNFIEKVIIVFIWGVWIITVLSNLGYNVSALVAGAGVGGIAIALAAQKTVANVFWALTVLINRPYQIWDYIKLGNYTWVVKDIGLTYTKLLVDAWYEVMITNESILSTVIENMSKRSYRRADFSIGLVYHTTLAQMQKGVQIIEAILQEYVELERLESFRVNFETFGDFSLNINVTYFSHTFEYLLFLKEKEQINLEIKKRFQKAKLEMAFPTTEMIIKSGDIKA